MAELLAGAFAHKRFRIGEHGEGGLDRGCSGLASAGVEIDLHAGRLRNTIFEIGAASVSVVQRERRPGSASSGVSTVPHQRVIGYPIAAPIIA